MSNNLKVLFFIGRPFSPFYGLVMRVREQLYLKGFFKKHSLSIPVISVGNLVLGGTGKTPIVRYIAEFLKAKGFNPAIISRGYGGTANRKVNIVSDTIKVLLPPQQAGDEPYMLADALPGVPVLTGKRRIYPSKWAANHLQADILILDDGFQHLSVQRDIDLVLFNGTDLAGNSRIFPGGMLREPVAALHRCSAFLVTGVNENNREIAECFGGLLKSRFNNKPVFYSSINDGVIKNPADGTIVSLEEKVFYGFCGIAHPARFSDSLKNLGIELAGFTALPDHARYSQLSLDKICAKAHQCGAKYLITTEKDYVKIRKFDVSMPITLLEIRARVEHAFDDFILAALQFKKK